MLEAVSALEAVDEERPWKPLQAEFTVNFPPGMSPDLAIVERIRREFFAEYVPLWVRKPYKNPAGHLVVAGWHCIGEWAPLHNDPMKEPRNVDRPLVPTPLFPFQGGVVYDLLTMCDLWAPGSRGERLNAPPDFVPYDERVYHFMQATDRVVSREYGNLKQKVKTRIDLRKAAEDKELERVEENA